MCEIIILVLLCRKLASMAAEKGHSRGYAAFGALFWIVGEIIGVGIGLALEMDMGAIVPGFMGAGLGALIAYMIVARLPNRNEGVGELATVAETFR